MKWIVAALSLAAFVIAALKPLQHSALHIPVLIAGVMFFLAYLFWPDEKGPPRQRPPNN
jgi:hypothetical protein